MRGGRTLWDYGLRFPTAGKDREEKPGCISCVQTANVVTKRDAKRAVLSTCHFVLDGGSFCGVYFYFFMGNKVTTAKRTSAIKVCVDVCVGLV